MYYQFNNFTGRLIGSSHMQPYFPVSARPLDKSEPPKLVFLSKNEKIAKTTPPVRQASQKSVIPGTNVQYGPMPEALKRKMELFQKPDGIPVHLKGGAMDKALFGLTIGLCIIGLGQTFHFFYQMSKK